MLPLCGNFSETKFVSNESLSDDCSSLSITSLRDEVFSGPDLTNDISSKANEDAVAHEDAVASEDESSHSGLEPDHELGQFVNIDFLADEAIHAGNQGVDQTPPAA